MNKRWIAAPVAMIVIAGACGGDDDGAFDTVVPRTTESTASSTETTSPSSAPASSSTTTTGPTTTTTAAVPTATWTLATSNLEGLPSECGNLTSVFTRPDRDEVIAGVALQGLWSSLDGSDTWVQLGTGPGSDTIINRPTALIVDPTDPNRWWESGIYQGGGVTAPTTAGDVPSARRRRHE